MQDLHINIYSSAHKQNQPILGYHQVRGFDEKSEISNRTVYMVHSNSLRKSKLSSVSCPHMSFNMKIIWLSVQLDFFFFFFFPLLSNWSTTHYSCSSFSNNATSHGLLLLFSCKTYNFCPFYITSCQLSGTTCDEKMFSPHCFRCCVEAD